ncbi:ImmA/IrrE family metallo-endopeptidase [Micromonospora sp. WMMD1155]|nr:DUF6545 domain-containing protein [Micromonospora sp. WMMD1155]WFE53047.1 ImmA/IrrE family metallo-endopeptidase [Micromonospora sp. WMMD1155]
MIWARGRIARRLRNAGLPPPPAPYTVDAWCEAIAHGRGRPIHLRGERLGMDLPSAFLIKLEHADIIIVDSALPMLPRTQGILHELAHLVLNHSGDALHAEVDPAVEAEAELAADLLFQRLSNAATVACGAMTSSTANSIRSQRRWWPTSWWTDRQMDWQVNQLWMTLRAGMPEAAIITTTTTEKVPVEIGGSRQRYRRVVEVHEALRLLRPWYSRQVHDSATQRAQRYQLDATSTAAVVEAAQVAVALRRHQTEPPSDDVPRLPQRRLAAYDIRAEARRLALVGLALHDSPLVAAELARWSPVAYGSRPEEPGSTAFDSFPITPLNRAVTRNGWAGAA